MCKETKFGLAAGILMIIVMAIGVRTNETTSDRKNLQVEKNTKKSQTLQFQTTSRESINLSTTPGPHLE